LDDVNGRRDSNDPNHSRAARRHVALYVQISKLMLKTQAAEIKPLFLCSNDVHNSPQNQRGAMVGLDDKVSKFREQQAAAVARLKADLEPWIEQHSGRPRVDNPNENFPEHYVEISQALLETAIDRYIRLYDAPDALFLIESCFRRQAEKLRRALQ
jgi:hypothetical protein